MPETVRQRVYCLRLLFLCVSGQEGAYPPDQDGKGSGEAENERKGGEEIMSQTKAISGPYLRTEQTTRNIMLHVSISLIPALLGAVYYFGV